MIYTLTAEEQNKIDTLYKKLDEKMLARKGAPAEAPKETVLEYIETVNKEFSNTMEKIENEHFKKLQSPQAILKDAQEVIEDAIIFEYAGTTYGMKDEKRESKWDCILLTDDYTQFMGDYEFLSWNYMQKHFKDVKETQEKPKIKLVKSGLMLYLQKIAIPKHLKALKGTPQEEELNEILNKSLDKSKYVVDDSKVEVEPLATRALSKTSKRRGLILNENYDVAMANVLIQNGVNTLNATELKILRLAILQAKVGDTEFYEYEVAAVDLAKFLNLDVKNLYKNLEKMTEHIQQAYVKIKNEEKQKFYTQSWVDHCYYAKGKIIISLAPGLKPYILGLKNCFSKIKFEEYINYKSQHTIIIRELLESKMGNVKPHADVTTQIDIPLEELKERTNTKKEYADNTRFKNRVIDIAVKEINDFSVGYHVTATPYKNGKRIEGFTFLIESQINYMRRTPGDPGEIKILPGRKKTKRATQTEDRQITLRELFDMDF